MGGEIVPLIVFLILIGILQAIGRFVEFIQEQAQQHQARQQQLRRQQGAPGAPEPPPAKRETPLEAMLRALQEAAEPPKPAPRPKPKPKPKPAPRVTVARKAAESQRGKLADRHLTRSTVGDQVEARHLHTTLGARGELTGFQHIHAAREATAWERIDRLPVLQRAIVLSEVLGKPRCYTPWEARKL